MSGAQAEQALAVVIGCLCLTAFLVGLAHEVRRQWRKRPAKDPLADLRTYDEDATMRMVNPTPEERARRRIGMPPRHPEQFLAPLRDAEEEWLASVDAELWPEDTTWREDA